jgi:large subunit ribosomal protein L19
MDNVRNEDVGLPYKTHWKMPWNATIRSANLRLEEQLDQDGRKALFDPTSPTRVEPGSIIMVEQISSRTRPRKMVFSGVLINVRWRGVGSTFVIRNFVLGTGVEVMYPVYSPMITNIKVLKRVNGTSTRKVNRFMGEPQTSLKPNYSEADRLASKEIHKQKLIARQK